MDPLAGLRTKPSLEALEILGGEKPRKPVNLEYPKLRITADSYTQMTSWNVFGSLALPFSQAFLDDLKALPTARVTPRTTIVKAIPTAVFAWTFPSSPGIS